MSTTEQYKRHIPTILMHTMKGDVNQNMFRLSISFKEFNTVIITLEVHIFIVWYTVNWFCPVFPLHCFLSGLKSILVFFLFLCFSVLLPLPMPSVWVCHGGRTQQVSLFSLSSLRREIYSHDFLSFCEGSSKPFFLNSSLVSPCSWNISPGLSCFDLSLSKYVRN